MSRLVPFPLLSACLLAIWLLLAQSLNPGSVMLGAVLAIIGGHAMAALHPARARIRRPGVMLWLALRVVADIVRSNVAVAGIILGFGSRRRRAGFVRIPLELRDPYGLAALACIITATPGTIWVEFDSAAGAVIIHVLDLVDEAAWIRTIKGRYERPLMEIFE